MSCSCEGPWFSSKDYTTNMFLLKVVSYFLKIGLVQISINHETLFKVCYVRIHVDISSTLISLNLRPSPSSVKWTWTVSAFFDEWEILECNGHGPWVSCEVALRGLFSVAVTNVPIWMNVLFHIHQSRSHRFHPHNPNPFAKQRHEREERRACGARRVQFCTRSWIDRGGIILNNLCCGDFLLFRNTGKTKNNISGLSCYNDDDGGGQRSEGATRLDPSQSGWAHLCQTAVRPRASWQASC
jgi:hypothetical protein